MAFNLNALKGLFSKLKPAAKTVANYGDDVAQGIVKYGDDVASSYSPEMTRLLQTAHNYDSAISHGAIPSKLDKFLQPSAKSHINPRAAVATDIRDASLNPLWDASEIDLSKLTHNVDDIVDTPYSYANTQRGLVLTGDNTGRYGYSPDWHNASTDDLVRKSTHTWKMRKDGDYEFPVPIAEDSYLQLDPDAYKSKMSWEPDVNATVVLPQDFGQRASLIDSVDFPDGFTNPDDFARYYDALESGVVPKEFTPDEFAWAGSGIIGKQWDAEDRTAMELAYNLLNQSELGMPMGPRTFDQAQMLVKKYLEPSKTAMRDGGMPHQKFVKGRWQAGDLYDLYEDILNYKKSW